MVSCEIYDVPFKNSFAWKWRAVDDSGRLIESPRTYALYYECLSAARERGYEPKPSRARDCGTAPAGRGG
jgi:hypothetical protein